MTPSDNIAAHRITAMQDEADGLTRKVCTQKITPGSIRAGATLLRIATALAICCGAFAPALFARPERSSPHCTLMSLACLKVQMPFCTSA